MYMKQLSLALVASKRGCSRLEGRARTPDKRQEVVLTQRWSDSFLIRTLLLATIVVVTACGTTSNNPLAPSAALSSGTGQEISAAHNGHFLTVSARQTAVCHRTNGTNPFIPLSVSPAALDAHLAHGDAVPGAAVPGDTGMVFNDACTPVPAGSQTVPIYNFVSMACFGGTGATPGFGTDRVRAAWVRRYCDGALHERSIEQYVWRGCTLRRVEDHARRSLLDHHHGCRRRGHSHRDLRRRHSYELLGRY